MSHELSEPVVSDFDALSTIILLSFSVSHNIRMIDDFSKVVGLDCAKNAKEELAIGKFA
jgi:hypothetical protein